MLGLMFLLFAGICLLVFVKFLRQLQSRSSTTVSVVVALILVSLPILDVWLNQKSFEAKCANAARFEALRVGPSVEGIAIEGADMHASLPDTYGYQFVETYEQGLPNSVARAVSTGMPNAAAVFQQASPQAKYVVREERGPETHSFIVRRITVREIATDDLLASHDYPLFRGGYTEGFFTTFFTGAGRPTVRHCKNFNSRQTTVEMLHAVLPPASRSSIDRNLIP